MIRDRSAGRFHPAGGYGAFLDIAAQKAHDAGLTNAVRSQSKIMTAAAVTAVRFENFNDAFNSPEAFLIIQCFIVQIRPDFS